jgi:DNA repair protein RadA/Sms
MPQLRARAERLGVLCDGLLAASTTDAAAAVAVLESASAPELVIVDSVQTMHAASVEGASGSVSQVRAVAAACVEAAKRGQACLILVGHVTKDGQIAGPKLLEHMVDTVLYLEGERRHLFRILRVLKNRYGPTDELLVMEMREAGCPKSRTLPPFFSVTGTRPLRVRPWSWPWRDAGPSPWRSRPWPPNRFWPCRAGPRWGWMWAGCICCSPCSKSACASISARPISTPRSAVGSKSRTRVWTSALPPPCSHPFTTPLPPGAVLWGEVDLSGRIRPVAARTHASNRPNASATADPVPRHQGWHLSDLAAALFSRKG